LSPTTAEQEQEQEQMSSLERNRMPSSPVIGILASRAFAVLSLTAFWRHLLSVFPPVPPPLTFSRLFANYFAKMKRQPPATCSTWKK